MIEHSRRFVKFGGTGFTHAGSYSFVAHSSPDRQCFVEQKNGVVVGQVVGHGRLAGEQASRQLDQLYHALHWYVNCFQPRVLLVSKQIEERTIHRIYDTAKTPLQRVLLSGVLPAAQQQELRALGKAFDPLRLFQHMEQLQQATFRCEAGRSSASQTPPPPLVPFDLARCVAELVPVEGDEADEPPDMKPKQASVLDWKRTRNDPFVDQWEQILAWVQANPTPQQRRYPARASVTLSWTL